MKQRIAVLAIETTRHTSEDDIYNLMDVLELLSKKFNFKMSQTGNPEWVRALADEMEKEVQVLPSTI